MNLPIHNFDTYAFSKQPGYHEPTVRKAFAKAVPLRTVMTAFAVTTVKADIGPSGLPQDYRAGVLSAEFAYESA